MPLPLLWIGAAAVSALTVKGLADDRKTQQHNRKRYTRAKKYSELSRHDSPIGIYPTDMMSTEQMVKPVVGAIVCCGIGGVLDHTGIWVDDNTIVELDGKGLIKPVSVSRFTQNRTGKQIFIACDSMATPLACNNAAQRAISQIFQVRDYDVITNNCHQFIWQCFCPDDSNTTTFKDLNVKLATYFDREIYWDVCDA